MKTTELQPWIIKKLCTYRFPVVLYSWKKEQKQMYGNTVYMNINILEYLE